MKKMTLELAEKIHSAIKIINDKVPAMNMGGCGVFAVLFAKQMKKLGFDAKVYGLQDIVESWCQIDDDRANNVRLHEANVKHRSPMVLGVHVHDHYCVGIDGIYFDSTQISLKDADGCLNLDDDSLFTIRIEVPIEDLEYESFYKGRPGWNHKYNSHYNHIVKHIIETNLEILPQ